VRRRLLASWSIYAGLMIPIGIFGHVLFEQVGSVVRRRGNLEVDHLALLTAAAVMIACTLLALRRGTDGERRRRLAMVRSALPSGWGPLALSAGIQMGIAAASLFAEGVAVEPARLVIALAMAIAGILFGCFLFHAVRHDVLAIAAALVVDRAAHGMCAPGYRRECATLGRSIADTFRRDAGRAPPFTSTFVSI
jgi:hypothetical protein